MEGREQGFFSQTCLLTVVNITAYQESNGQHLTST